MPNTLHNDSGVTTTSSRVIAAAIIGVAFIIVLLLLAFLKPTPSAFQYEIFRIVLALAAAGFAAILPGAISAKFPWRISAAVGSLAIFAIVFFFLPAKLVSEPQSENNELIKFIQKLPKNFGISSEDSLSKKLHELMEDKKNSDVEKKNFKN